MDNTEDGQYWGRKKMSKQIINLYSITHFNYKFSCLFRAVRMVLGTFNIVEKETVEHEICTNIWKMIKEIKDNVVDNNPDIEDSKIIERVNSGVSKIEIQDKQYLVIKKYTNKW